jgi:hypothetical protein
MNINRHNYEEFFILYMDNELSSADRKLVEEFIVKNPDLADELEILKQYKLVPDDHIVFENKTQLIRQADNSPIHLANYQEWLLLYLDHELTAGQRSLVENFITKNTAARLEFDALNQTVVPSEQIIFENKEVLYRTEERIFRIPYWQRIAVAAILILVLATTAIISLSKKTGSQAGLAKTQPAPQETHSNNTATKNIDIKPVNKPGEAVIDHPVQPANTITPANTVVRTGNNRKDNFSNENSTKEQKQNNPLRKEETVIAENKPSNNLPKPETNFIKENSGLNVIADNHTKTDNTNIETESSLTTSPVTTTNVQPSYVNKQDNSEIDQDNGKKTKLRGLFRKATRIFEKTTNINATDNDRVLIGGLALKLK